MHRYSNKGTSERRISSYKGNIENSKEKNINIYSKINTIIKKLDGHVLEVFEKTEKQISTQYHVPLSTWSRQS